MAEPTEYSRWQIDPSELPSESLVRRDPEYGALAENAWFRLFCATRSRYGHAKLGTTPIMWLIVVAMGNLAFIWIWLMTSVVTFSFSTAGWILMINMAVASSVILARNIPVFFLKLPLGDAGPLRLAQKRYSELTRDLDRADRNSTLIARAWVGYYAAGTIRRKWISNLVSFSVCAGILLIVGLRVYWLDRFTIDGFGNRVYGVLVAERYRYLLVLVPIMTLLGVLWGFNLDYSSVVVRLAARARKWPVQRENDSTREFLNLLTRCFFILLRLAWRLLVLAGVIMIAGLLVDEFILDTFLEYETKRMLEEKLLKEEILFPALILFGLIVGFLFGALYAWRAQRNYEANFAMLSDRIGAFLNETYGEPVEKKPFAWRLAITDWVRGILRRPFNFLLWRAPWAFARLCFYAWILVWLVISTGIDRGYTEYFLDRYEIQSQSNGLRFLSAIPEAYTIVKWAHRGVQIRTTQSEDGRRQVEIILFESRTDFLDDLEGWLSESVTCDLSIMQFSPGKNNFLPLLTDGRLQPKLTTLGINVSGNPLPAGWMAGIDFAQFQKLKLLNFEAVPLETPLFLPASIESVYLKNCTGAQFVHWPSPADHLNSIGFSDMPLTEVTGFFAENPQSVQRLRLVNIVGLNDLNIAGIPSELESFSISSTLTTSFNGIEKFANLKSLWISQCASLPNEELLALSKLHGIETLIFNDWTVLQMPGSRYPNYDPPTTPFSWQRAVLEEAEWIEKRIRWEETLRKAHDQMNSR